MNRDAKMLALGLAVGVGVLLAAKYLVCGTDSWNAVVCPGRVEPASLVAFRKPFLAGVSDCPKCAGFWGL